MNDKIKEIVNGKVGFVFNHKDRDEILDLITVLQKKEDLFEKIVYKYDELKQENERLKKMEKFKFTLRKDETKAPIVIRTYEQQFKDYKSRCEKAREMIRFIAYNSERPLTMTELNKVYNILQGSDKE